MLARLQASVSDMDTRSALSDRAGCFGVTQRELSLPRATMCTSISQKGNPS